MSKAYKYHHHQLHLCANNSCAEEKIWIRSVLHEEIAHRPRKWGGEVAQHYGNPLVPSDLPKPCRLSKVWQIEQSNKLVVCMLPPAQYLGPLPGEQEMWCVHESGLPLKAYMQARW